jgi:hypothetical protein
VRSTTIEILGSFGTRERSVQETKNTKNKKSQQPPRLVLAPAAFYYGQLVDCTLEMRQLGWAHFAGKGLQSETEAILAEVSADGR